MRAARMHGYRQPLVLQDVKVPEIAADEVLLKVAAAGMCRTDAQMLDGYFGQYHPLAFPGPDRVFAVIGIGGLGAYAVQYAKLFASGATLVAFGRNDEKLAVAKEYGADHVINIKDKSNIRAELNLATGHKEIDAAVDCVGAEETIRMGFNLLATAGTYCSVGLVGTHIDIPLFPFVAREFTYHGSFGATTTI